MTFFDFLRNFQKNLNVKKFQKLEDLNPVIRICDGTLRVLGILPLKMAVLLVFEIRRFIGFFKIFQKTQITRYFVKVKVPTL